MPSSPSRVAGKVYKDVTIAGKTFRISRPKMVGIYAEIEAFILSRKEDPLVLAVRACKKAPESQHAAIWKAAMEAAEVAKNVTPAEMKAFEGSRWAPAFFLWKSLDKRHHDEVPDVEAAMALLEKEAAMSLKNLDEIMANVSVVQQDRDLKNFDGPTTVPGRTKSQSMDTQSSEDGQPSTSTSPTDSDGTETP